MTSLELVKKLVAHGANLNARMTKKVNVGLTSLNTSAPRPSSWPPGPPTPS